MHESEAFAEIAENLSFLDDWEDRYRYLIELGQALPALAEDLHTAENKVHGCASQVWLVAHAREAGGETMLDFEGDSDALIVKGLVAVLLALCSGQPARDLTGLDAVQRLDGLGLREHLSTQRSNGLVAMADRIRSEAASALA